MEGVSFQASLDRRLIDRMRGSAEVQQFVSQQWRHLNDRMGRYIADNLSAEVFQLIRIHRSEHWGINPHGDGLLTITLEVGLVTERTQVTVATQSNEIYGLWFDEASNGTTTTVSLEQQRALRDALRREQRRYQGRGVFPQAPLSSIVADAPPAPKPDPVLHKRHILIDKKNPTPENTP